MDTFEPAKLNWALRKGDSFVHTHIIRDSQTQVPVNLTGAVFSGSVAGTPLTCSVVNATAGQLRYSLSPAQTLLLNTGTLKWFLQCTYADGTVQTYFTGNIVVTE